MIRPALIFSSLALIGSTVASQSGARQDSPRPGTPAPGYEWREERRLAYCEQKRGQPETIHIAIDSGGVVIDSAAAVARARRALHLEGKVVRRYQRMPNGVILHFDLPRRPEGMKDGTATVYVEPSGCVVHLGW